MHSIKPTNSPSSYTYKASRGEEIINKLRYIQCEPHEVVDMRQELIYCGYLPKSVSSIMCRFKARILKTPEAMINTAKKRSFLQAILESDTRRKSTQCRIKSRKQKSKPNQQFKEFPYISTATITEIEQDPSESNIKQLRSYLSNAKIYITDVPQCVVILTKAMVNNKKIISDCYKYKQAVNMYTHLTDEEKSIIRKHIETYLQNIKVKIHSPQPENASEQLEEIKNQLQHPPVTLDQLVEIRHKLKQLGQTTKEIRQIIQDYTYKLKTSSLSQEDKERYLEEALQSMHLTRTKLAEQAMQTYKTANKK